MSNRNSNRKSYLAGLCRDCGKRAPKNEKSVICGPCSKKRVDRSKRWKKEKLKDGKCQCCSFKIEKDRTAKTLCELCSKKQIAKFKERRRKNKLKVLNYFGCHCSHCGITDYRLLTLDHINGDRKNFYGSRQTTQAWYAKLIKCIDNGQEWPLKLQVPCFNCHAIKDLFEDDHT